MRQIACVDQARTRQVAHLEIFIPYMTNGEHEWGTVEAWELSFKELHAVLGEEQLNSKFPIMHETCGGLGER